MIKVDLITMSGTKNYGSALQTYATQEFFKKAGLYVTVINYVRPDSLYCNLLNTWCGKNIVKRIVMFPTIMKWKKIFTKFYCNVNFSESIYSEESDFNNYYSDANMFCTGSDQVWNSVWNLGVIKPMYLNFIKDSDFRFAFGASFGQSIISDDEVYKTKNLINKYNMISVREDEAVKVLTDQYHYNKVCHIIDPTLCLDGNFWREKCCKKKLKKKNYILIYNLNKSKDFDNYVKKLSQLTGLKVYRLCTRYDQMIRYGKPILVPDVIDFVNLIDNARYVVTDSFHATAFSMNLNTEPICIYPEEFGGRLKSFLKLVKCEHRHIQNYEDYEVLDRKVDFVSVNNILENERKKAFAFLEEVINTYKEGDYNG